MAQMKEQNKTPEKEWNKIDNQQMQIRCRVQNTGDQDAQRTHWAQKQNKKDPGRNEVYTKWNKENLQGTKSVEDEAGIQINNLEHKGEISIQS